MPAHTKISFELVGLGSLLKERMLGVPIYQRSYSWESSQIEDYWSDLRSAFANSDPEYFLGTIVLTTEGTANRVSIIDGQQRIATTAILLAAIREEYKHRSDDRHEIIQTKYLADRDLGSGEFEPHLTLNSEDDSFFRSLIVGGGSHDEIVPSKSSHRLLGDAYTTLLNHVRTTADDAGTAWAAKLNSWVTFVSEQVRVIAVDVPSEADAFLIFETLNDRGADLTIADLLKNYLFGKSGNRLDVVRDAWMQALGALDLVSEVSIFTAFLRHYWSSKYGATRERELYKSIKKEVTGETAAVELADQLRKASNFYAAIQSSDHEFWSGKGSSTKANVETLLKLDLEQHRPLLLAGMQHFTTPELKNLLRALVAWSVRGLLVGGIGGGSTERAYCDAAVKIRGGDIKTVAELRSELSAIIPSDEEFRVAFATARIPKAGIARYLLIALQKGADNKAEPELVPNEDEDQVNLEHILPKSSKRTDWSAFSEEDAKAYTHRLGNMALLSKGPNGRIGNKAWTIKKPILAESMLSLTNQTSAAQDWNIEEIEERQTRLGELAVSVWPA